VVTALVADPDPIARRRLVDLLGTVAWITAVREATTASAALGLLAAHRPQLVVVDAAVPDVAAFDVARQLQGPDERPALVFTSSCARDAVHAFEWRAVDYLLKPVEPARLSVTLERVREMLDARAHLARLARAATSDAAPPEMLDRLFVREGFSLKPLALAEVARISGEDDYAALHAGGRAHLVSLRLRDLEARLPSPPFLRVHRSHLVNLDHVERLRRLDEARLEVVMKDGATVPVSRSRSREIRRLAR